MSEEKPSVADLNAQAIGLFTIVGLFVVNRYSTTSVKVRKTNFALATLS
jgi:hypothetical protein